MPCMLQVPNLFPTWESLDLLLLYRQLRFPLFSRIREKRSIFSSPKGLLFSQWESWKTYFLQQKLHACHNWSSHHVPDKTIVIAHLSVWIFQMYVECVNFLLWSNKRILNDRAKSSFQLPLLVSASLSHFFYCFYFLSSFVYLNSSFLFFTCSPAFGFLDRWLSQFWLGYSFSIRCFS